MKKKILSLILCACALLTIIPMTTTAADNEYIQINQPVPIFNNADDVTPDFFYTETAWAATGGTDFYNRTENVIQKISTAANTPLCAGVTTLLNNTVTADIVDEIISYNYVKTNESFPVDRSLPVLEIDAQGYAKVDYDGNTRFVKYDSVLHRYTSPTPGVDKMVSAHNIFKVVEKTDTYVKISRSTSRSESFYGYIPNLSTNKYFNPDFTKYYDQGTENTANIFVRQQIVNNAKTHIGGQYVWGGTSYETGVDCSGFVQLLYRELGYNIGRCTTYQLMDGNGRYIDVTDLKPGDLIYYSKDGITPYHVVMYAGNGECVEAKSASIGIVQYPVEWDRILAIKSFL